MIHRVKNPDGSYSFRAYSYRHVGKDGWQVEFLDAFDTSEAAKDRLQVAIAEQVESIRKRVVALRLALHSEVTVNDTEEQLVDACAETAVSIEEDFYFVASNAEDLFSDMRGGERSRSLHGEAAIAYAARHDLMVRYAELERGNFKPGFPHLVTPGRARELMPEARERWLFIEAPDDMVTSDLPQSGRPWDYKEPGPSSPEELRKLAAMHRESVAFLAQRAEEYEARAAALEAAQP